MRRMKFLFIFLGLSLVFAGHERPAAAAETTGIAQGSVKAENIQKKQAMVKRSLRRLVSAYQQENARRFMEMVSEDYTGDDSILDSAIRRDFSAFTNISMRYTFNNITSDGQDKISVSVNFTRGQTEVRTGKSTRSSGATGLVFRMEDGVYKLYSMGRPPLFGLLGD